MSGGKSAACAATCGMHVDKHRPSKPATDLHVGGVYWFAYATKISGAQVVVASHVASKSPAPAGRSAFGTHLPLVQPGMLVQPGKVLVSSTGAAGCTQPPPSPASGEAPPVDVLAPVPAIPPLATKPPVE